MKRRDRSNPSTVTLGGQYVDTITGFEGTATGRHEYLYGCVRITLEGGKDGKAEQETFDEQRLVEAESRRAVLRTATSGGPRSEPAQREPTR